MKDREAKIILRLDIPESMLGEFLQYVRDFEQTNPALIHFSVAVYAPGLKGVKVQELLRSIKPPLPYEMFIPLEKPN